MEISKLICSDFSWHSLVKCIFSGKMYFSLDIVWYCSNYGVMGSCRLFSVLNKELDKTCKNSREVLHLLKVESKIYSQRKSKILENSAGIDRPWLTSYASLLSGFATPSFLPLFWGPYDLHDREKGRKEEFGYSLLQVLILNVLYSKIFNMPRCHALGLHVLNPIIIAWPSSSSQEWI